METLEPIPNGTEVVIKGEGKGIVVESFKRQTSRSFFVKAVEHVYDVRINGKVRRVFNSQIVGNTEPTLNLKHRYVNRDYSKYEMSDKRKEKIRQIDERCKLAMELVKSGATKAHACRTYQVDHKSLTTRYPQL